VKTDLVRIVAMLDLQDRPQAVLTNEAALAVPDERS
jgi:hypothetical protein